MNETALFFQENSLLLPEGASITLTEWDMPLSCTNDFTSKGASLDIFTVPDFLSGKTITAVFIPPDAPLPPRWQAVPVRQVFSVLANSTPGVTGTMLRAFHIGQWRRESLYCGSCGNKNTGSPIEPAARVCSSCGRMEFPRITPAIMVIITNSEGKILLAHNKKFAPGLYSLIAGFSEAGETLEETVERETREETGIEIRDIQYVCSQPWPFPNSLMIGFSASYASGTLRPDGDEIEDVQWFSRENLPNLPNPGSLSRLLIDRWRA